MGAVLSLWGIISESRIIVLLPNDIIWVLLTYPDLNVLLIIFVVRSHVIHDVVVLNH